MRLIDADKLIEDMRYKRDREIIVSGDNMILLSQIQKVVDAQPTAYSVDEVVEQITLMGGLEHKNWNDKMIIRKKVLEIVKGGVK